jgi:hypothetical protein
MPVKPASQVVARPVTWLWPKMIPQGKLLILDGDPDLGKSLIALDLCARLSTGRPFPDGQAGPGAANALVLSAEDNPADTVIPRLRRLGADPQRVHVWERDRDDEEWPWRFPAQIGRLDEALSQTDARLVVIDPVSSFLDESVLCASDQSVRRALAPLMHQAEKHRCAVLMHRHLNKQGGGRALYRGLGSIAFVAACRFAMLVGRDPLERGRSVLAQVRNSLAAPQPSLAYRLTAVGDEPPTVDWLGPSPFSADELLSAAGKERPRDRAAAFLGEFLAAGPRTSDEIWEAARKAGLSARTVERAKAGLDVRSRRGTAPSGGPVSYWHLPDQEVPPVGRGDTEIDRLLADLERRFPPPNPLDPEGSEGDEEGE